MLSGGDWPTVRRRAVRSSTPRDLSGLCPRCFLKLDLCLCFQLTRLRSNLQIVIVRHVREERLTSNTGRLAALLLSNVRLVPYGGDEPFDEGLLRGDDTWLLFPDAKPAVPPGQPQCLVLLDATFRQPETPPRCGSDCGAGRGARARRRTLLWREQCTCWAVPCFARPSPHRHRKR